MKFLRIDLKSRRNGVHFQFFTEVVELLRSSETIVDRIQQQFQAMYTCYTREDEVLKKIRKSPLTEKINLADRERSSVFRGMSDSNRGALNHFNPEIREAAKRNQIVFNTYGNVAAMAIDDKTSAIHNLAAELESRHAEDMEAVGLMPWLEELVSRNEALTDLVRRRYTEQASQPEEALIDVRAELDEAYRAMTHCVEALWMMAMTAEDKATYADFIRMVNVIIEHYNSLHSRNKGNAGNDAEGDITEPDVPQQPDAEE